MDPAGHGADEGDRTAAPDGSLQRIEVDLEILVVDRLVGAIGDHFVDGLVDGFPERAILLADGDADTLADLLDIYLSSVSNRLNTEVRILTVLTTLFMPATLIAGVFGMNFQHMPLLDERDGFWIALGVMGSAAAVMAAAFWRRNWLKTR